MPDSVELDPRFLRQVLLREVGPEGQRKLSAARACVGGPGLAHEVAELYVRGAGFARVDPGTVDVEDLAPSGLMQRHAAREVLAGARAALRAIRTVLSS